MDVPEADAVAGADVRGGQTGRRLVVEADGGSRGNPGPAGCGAVVRDAGDGTVLAEVADSIGVATNNVAEYRGLLAGLRAAAEIAAGIDGEAAVEVRMDSKLVVEQMSGRWQVKHPDLRPLAADAARLGRSFAAVAYTWVPRAHNARADALANEAMDAAEGSRGGATGTASRSGAGGAGGVRAQATAAVPAAATPVGSAEAPQPAPAATSRPAPLGTGWLAATGEPTVTLLLRHGQTPRSVQRRFAGTDDADLTETGRWQASRAAQRLAADGRVRVIVASPLRRTRQTAEVVAAATGAEVVVEERFRETAFGDWEGLTFAEVRGNWPQQVAVWLRDPAVAPPGGESFVATAERVRAGLRAVLDGYPRTTVLVVSHVTPIKTLLADALLAPPAALHRMHLDVACLNEIDWYADGPAVVRSLNDTAHLR